MTPSEGDRAEPVGYTVQQTASTAGNRNAASPNLAVEETAAHTDKDDLDAPLLPVALKVEAYPVKPSPSLPEAGNRAQVAAAPAPSSPAPNPVPSEATHASLTKEDRPPFVAGGLSTASPRDESASVRPEAGSGDRDSARASALIDIPGFEDSTRSETRSTSSAPEARRDPAPREGASSSVSQPPAQRGHTDHSYGRPRLDPATNQTAAAPGTSNKFRVTPAPATPPTGSIFDPDPAARRGPISRMLHRIRGEN